MCVSKHNLELMVCKVIEYNGFYHCALRLTGASLKVHYFGGKFSTPWTKETSRTALSIFCRIFGFHFN